MEVGVMPKQQVIGEAGSDFDVVVGWSADQYVQVGIEAAGGVSLLTRLYGDETSRTQIATKVIELVTSYQQAQAGSPAQLGSDILDVIETVGSTPANNFRYRGAFSTLSRHGCNEVIKHLRRARDVAFGKDQ